MPLHPRIAALVDGDAAGKGYANDLAGFGAPNSGVIIRWPDNWAIEDVIGWLVEADKEACLGAIEILPAVATVADLVQRLKSENRTAHGIKNDTSAYENIANSIGETKACCQRAVNLLNAITSILQGHETTYFAPDPRQPTVRILQP